MQFNTSKVISFYIWTVPVFILVFAFSFPGCKEKPFQKVGLEMWGVFDDSDVYQSLIDRFNEDFPYIEIKYRKKTYSSYEKDLLEAMASGRGPDIFMLHNSWVPRYENKIVAAPQKLITPKEVQDNFVDVVFDDFVINGQIAALPLSVDTLALYYNKDIFNTEGIAQPPQTWEEFLEDVEKITVRDDRGNILRAGAALGTARNINRSTDILSLLMLQSGTPIVDWGEKKAVFDEGINLPDGEIYYPGRRALRFYTSFADPTSPVYTWNRRMHYSIDAFYEGKVAMMLNYAYHLPTLRAKAPYLNFGVAFMPQIKTASKNINYANYWGLAVSHNSKNPEAAWSFIKWVTEKENAQEYLRLTKKPTARRDLVSWQKDDSELGVFALQALSAFSWKQSDNSVIEKYFAEMIESVVIGEASVEEAIEKTAQQITFLMEK